MNQVAETLGIAYQTGATWRDNYHTAGLAALSDKARSGRPLVISGDQRAKITALPCSTAPEGHARWSLRLLADKYIELESVDSVSHTEVGKMLKKTN